ncbi:MAG: DUF2911 domain-containing protein [Candidatus Sulfotelmatobacter sp.]
MQKRIALLTCFLFSLTIIAACQGNRPSPAASASCDLGGGKTITTKYSSPRMKGRKIYGGLVPFGEVWRNGANEATTLVTSTDLVVGGKSVPAGSYTLFVLPESDKWTLIINKKTTNAGKPLWGIPYKWEADELARTDMKLSKLPSPVEDFTITYDKTATGCTLREEWDTTRATIDIAAK